MNDYKKEKPTIIILQLDPLVYKYPYKIKRPWTLIGFV